MLTRGRPRTRCSNISRTSATPTLKLPTPFRRIYCGARLASTAVFFSRVWPLQIFLGSPTIGPELAQRLGDGREATNNNHDHELANSLRAIFLRQSDSESQPGPQYPAHTSTNSQPEREPEQRTEVDPAQQQHQPEPEPDLSPEGDGELRPQRARREDESTPSWWIPHPIFKPPSSKPRWLPHTNPDRIIPRRRLRAEPFGPFLVSCFVVHSNSRSAPPTFIPIGASLTPTSGRVARVERKLERARRRASRRASWLERASPPVCLVR